MGKQCKQWQTLSFWAPKSLQMVIAAMKLKDAYAWKESYDQLDSILKSRDITLPTKVHVVKAVVFPVVMYRCESWTIRKAECWRNDVFQLWCWRSLLRVPWAGRKLNRSILKEINPEYSLEELMLKLKLQHFDHLMRRAKSLEKDPDAGKDRRQEENWKTGWDGWMASLIQWIWVWANSRK